MSNKRAIQGAARAITQMDMASFEVGDKDIGDWEKARNLLWDIIERNGYEITKPGYSSIRKIKKLCESCQGLGYRGNATPHAGKPPAGYVVIERCDSCERFKSDLEAAECFGVDAKWQNGNDTTQAIAKPKH